MHSNVSLLIAVRLMNEWANCGDPSTVLWEDSINFDWSEALVVAIDDVVKVLSAIDFRLLKGEWWVWV